MYCLESRILKQSILFAVILSFSAFSQQDTGSFTDSRDGKVYKTVKIGTQVWMAENLAYKPNEGRYIWDQRDSGYVAKYGYLYEHNTALKIVPSGWHLPSNKEWKTLYDFLGGHSKKVRAALMAGGTSGFNALMSGRPAQMGINYYVSDVGKITGYWSSSKFPFFALVITSYNSITGGCDFSMVSLPYYNVRLIKD